MSNYGSIDPEFKAKWLAALRSGEFTQARQSLCEVWGKNTSTKGVAYCCIAVGAVVKHVQSSSARYSCDSVTTTSTTRADPMTNIIDARMLFTAKRQMTHIMLATGHLQRALPQGGTVAVLHEYQDWPPSDTEIAAWLEEFKDA